MIEIIPAIDIIEGKCVRLQQGDYSLKKIYNDDPLEVARKYEAAGLRRLHLVDLDGAKAKHVVNLKVLDIIASKTRLIIDFGGGIKTEKDIEAVFNSGASMATVGSVAISSPDLLTDWINKYSSEKIILGADIKDNRIAISGWKKITDVLWKDFLLDFTKRGIRNVLCTDISKDGMLLGSSIDLYEEMKKYFPGLNIIASGGITDINEIHELDKKNIYGVIIGKAIYEGKIELKDLRRFLVSSEQ